MLHRKFMWGFVITIVMLVTSMLSPTRADAWNGGIYYKSEKMSQLEYEANELAISKISLSGMDGKVREVRAENIQQGKSIRLARLIDDGGGWAVAKNHETIYHYLRIERGNAVLVGGTNKLAFMVSGRNDNGRHIGIVDDLTEAMVGFSDAPYTGLSGYIIDETLVTYWMKYVDDDNIEQIPYVYDVSYSANRRFATFWLGWKDFIRIDFQTGEMRAFASLNGSPNDGQYTSSVSAISNDGRFVFMRNGKTVIEVSSKCGYVLNQINFKGYVEPGYIQCPQYNLDTNEVAGYGGLHMYFQLADDERSAKFFMTPYGGTTAVGDQVKITISLDADFGGDRLKYLAMGDSYSSGEGDTGRDRDGNKYYLSSTAEKGGCHVSTRSYPYLLRDKWGFGFNDMRNIACSGAKVVMDYMTPLDKYSGQSGGLNKPPESSREARITNALESYIQGLVPQMEFIKKYKPSYLTITGGGNDVGFGEIIKYCASDFLEEYVGLTCDYAKHGYLNDVLTDAIDSQYLLGKSLINKIKEASPKTRIYYVGYPSFISENVGNCNLNVGLLNSNERGMINLATKRLNGVLRQVAADTEIMYIDIEDALYGGRLCEGSTYMTGIIAADVRKVLGGEEQEVFHPNSKGHENIANKIAKQIPDPRVNYTPEPSTQNTINPKVRTLRKEMLNSTVISGLRYVLNFGSGVLLDNSYVKVNSHSEPTHLGDFTTDLDGSLNVEVEIPDTIPVGMHLVIAEGTDPAGEPVRFYQYINVVEPENAETTDVAKGNTGDELKISLGETLPASATTLFASSNTNSSLSFSNDLAADTKFSINKPAVTSGSEVLAASADRQKNNNIVFYVILAILSAILLSIGAFYATKTIHKKEP